MNDTRHPARDPQDLSVLSTLAPPNEGVRSRRITYMAGGSRRLGGLVQSLLDLPSPLMRLLNDRST